MHHPLSHGERLYLEDLPPKPYCKARQGRLLIRAKEQAISFPLVQINHPCAVKWLVFDIDAPDAQFRSETRGCPEPTFIAINPENGHAHIAYRLASPVITGPGASLKAAQFLEDVKRGLTNRLGADPSYCGLLAKNPLWPGWAVQWLATRPYELATLNDCLTTNDKRRNAVSEAVEGRNVFLFTALRKKAIGICLEAKRTGRPQAEFEALIVQACLGLNASFAIPLPVSEAKGVAKSVSKWTWRKFTREKFAAIQARRARSGWAKVERESASRPWEALGISRRTWERRRKAKRLIS